MAFADSANGPQTYPRRRLEGKNLTNRSFGKHDLKLTRRRKKAVTRDDLFYYPVLAKRTWNTNVDLMHLVFAGHFPAVILGNQSTTNERRTNTKLAC